MDRHGHELGLGHGYGHGYGYELLDRFFCGYNDTISHFPPSFILCPPLTRPHLTHPPPSLSILSLPAHTHTHHTKKKHKKKVLAIVTLKRFTPSSPPSLLARPRSHTRSHPILITVCRSPALGRLYILYEYTRTSHSEVSIVRTLPLEPNIKPDHTPIFVPCLHPLHSYTHPQSRCLCVLGPLPPCATPLDVCAME